MKKKKENFCMTNFQWKRKFSSLHHGNVYFSFILLRIIAYSLVHIGKLN